MDTERIDINDIRIDYDKPAEERAAEYIKQIKNPYAFRCGEVAVNVQFSEGGKSLENALASYLISLKQNG